MRNLIFSILALFIFSSSQAQDKVRYTQKSPEIEIVKAYYKAYSDGNWEAFTAFYSKDAVITHNDSKELSPAELLEGVKYHAERCVEFGISVPDDELERVITDKGEMWVNAWGTWAGVVKGSGEKISFPTHSTFQFKNGKIVEEHVYYDDSKLRAAIAQDKVRYTQQAPEIETTKAYFTAYNEGEWEKLSAFYAKDASITHNTSPKLTAAQLLGGFKSNLELCTDYKWELIEEELERVITDKGEMWVNIWGNWTGTYKITGDKINVPTHHAFRFKEGKIIREWAYYDTAEFNDAKKAVEAKTNPPIHFIEMWTATDAWKNLSQKERGEYMVGLADPIQGLMEQGVEIISWGVNEGDTDQRADYDFYAVWSFPNAAIKQAFEKAVEGSGWYKYFEQKNLAGKNIGVEAVMGTLIGM